MKNILTGKVKDFVPSFYAKIEHGRIILRENGNLALTVDTGFNDYFALPKQILAQLDLEYVAMETFILANGTFADIKTYQGEVNVGGKIFHTLLIEGDFLISVNDVVK